MTREEIVEQIAALHRQLRKEWRPCVRLWKI